MIKLILAILLCLCMGSWADTPWLTGPIVAPHGTAVPAGSTEFDWYWYLNTFNADYNGDWKSVDTSNFHQFNPQIFAYIGLTPWMDLNMIAQFSVNWTEGAHAIGFNDFLAGFDFQLFSADANTWFPGIKTSIREIFPTGKYDRLNPHKLYTDQTGLGSFTTLIALVLYKVYPLWDHHSLSLTVNGEYGITTPTHVHGFNAYGGGYGTRGTVKQGNTFTATCSFEFTLTQNWVLSLDNVWSHYNSSHFSGQPGIDENGNPATIGFPSGETISFCPAIEYNFSVNFGVIAGCWFSALGRNSSQFRNAVMNIYTLF